MPANEHDLHRDTIKCGCSVDCDMRIHIEELDGETVRLEINHPRATGKKGTIYLGVDETGELIVALGHALKRLVAQDGS